MRLDEKKISLIMAIYNGENYIEEQINSIIRALKKISNYEIIVIDDCSEDGTLDIIISKVPKEVL